MLVLFKYFGYLLFLPFWWLQPFISRKKNIWVFGAWNGHRFSDNSKYLYAYVLENHPEIKPIWLTRESDVKAKVNQEGGKAYLIYSIKGFYYSLLAKNVIVSSGKRDVNYFCINGANTIQLWHGNPMKKIGRDDKYSNANSFFHSRIVPVFFPFIDNFNYDYLVSNSSVFTEKMASAFNMPINRIWETGCPRNDVFSHTEPAMFNQELRTKFEDCRLAYYLPTFRNHEGAKSLFNLNGYDKKILEEFLRRENVVLVSKGHYVDNRLKEDIQDPNSRLIHLSDENVDDINFMLKDADLLITDYSGAYFDFLLTQRPIVFAAFDLKEYLLSSRELYFKYDEIVAGPIVENWSELYSVMQSIWGESKYLKLVAEKNAVFNKFQDNKNSKRVFERIDKL